MPKTKVSVVVPVYNTEKYLEKCLDSLASQTLQEIEIIVVDDGSPDDSFKIIDDYVERYPLKINAYRKENGGLSDARNYGIERANGEYIGFVDSDDWVESRMFELLYEHAYVNDHDIVLCDINNVYVDYKTHSYYGFDSIPKKVDFILKSTLIPSACNKLFRKSLFEIHKFEKIWYEDLGLTPILLTHAESIGYIPVPLYNYRTNNPLSITHSNSIRTLDYIKAWDRTMTLSKKEFKKEISSAVYFNICYSLTVKPLYVEQLLEYFKNNINCFKDNKYISKQIEKKESKNLFELELIPKKIHYFWFGENPWPEYMVKCIESWREYAKGYEIINWDEKNCDVNECKFTKEAYAQKNWAFLSDYFRFKVLKEQGGICVDTDVVFTAPIDILRLSRSFFTFDESSTLNVCIIGSIPTHPAIIKIHDLYQENENSLDIIKSRAEHTLSILCSEYELMLNGREQLLDDDIKIFEPNVLIIDVYDGKNISIHLYAESWKKEKIGESYYKNRVLNEFFSTTEKEAIMVYKQKVDQMTSSLSWRITKPIRFCLDLIKVFLKNVSIIK